MGFIEKFKQREVAKSEFIEVQKEFEKMGYKEYENKVEHSENEYKVEYYLQSEKEVIFHEKYIKCSLIIKCYELDIDTSMSLFNSYGKGMSDSDKLIRLEQILNMSDEQIEQEVTKVVKNTLTKRSDSQKIEDIMKAINYKKGVVFIKK